MKKLDLVYFEDVIAVYIDDSLDFYTVEGVESIDWLDLARRAGVQADYIDATNVTVLSDGIDGVNIPDTLQALKEDLEAE